MPAGRPSDYNEDMLEFARDYLEHYEEHGHKVPSVVGLAKILRRPEKTLYAWGHSNPEFRKTLDQIVSDQKFELTNGGLGNSFNSNICKLMLANHGFSEKTQDVTGHNWNDEENKWEVEITHTKDVDAGKE